MDGIESMTRGWWRPTPGSIYPLLTRMSEEGTVKKGDDGRYELTPKARKELEFSFGPRFGRPQTPSDLVSHVKSLVSQMEDANRGMEKSQEDLRGELKNLAKRLTRLAGEDEHVETDDK